MWELNKIKIAVIIELHWSTTTHDVYSSSVTTTMQSRISIIKIIYDLKSLKYLLTGFMKKKERMFADTWCRGMEFWSNSLTRTVFSYKECWCALLFFTESHIEEATNFFHWKGAGTVCRLFWEHIYRVQEKVSGWFHDFILQMCLSCLPSSVTEKPRWRFRVYWVKDKEGLQF